MSFFQFAAMLLSASLLLTCSESKVDQSTLNELLPPPEMACGETNMVNISTANGSALGVFEVVNDSSQIWFSYHFPTHSNLQEIKVFMGEESSFSFSGEGYPYAAHYKFLGRKAVEKGHWYKSIPLNQFQKCKLLSVQVSLEEVGGNIKKGYSQGEKGRPKSIFQNCEKFCAEKKICEDFKSGDFLTLSWEDWLNPDLKWKSHLEKEFGLLFPTGLEIGCNYSLKFDNAGGVLGFLNSEGPAVMLNGTFLNPSSDQLQNSLAKELCVLSMSIALEQQKQNLDPGNFQLTELRIAKGGVKGWSVYSVLEEAKIVLGGCTSNYSADQLLKVLQGINGNFRPDMPIRNFLTCPENNSQ